MKRSLLYILPLFVLFFAMTGFAPPKTSGAEVRIDGKLIEPQGLLKFDRDDTVYLEAVGIKPNSWIHMKVKKGGIRWLKNEFKVDDTGEVKGILHIPEMKLTVTCFVNYYDSDGVYHEVKFKFKTV